MTYQPKSYRKFLAATATAAVVATSVVPAIGASAAVKKDTTPPSIKYSGLENGDRLSKADQKLDVRASTDTANIKVYQNGKLIKTIKAVSGSVAVKLNKDIKKGKDYANTFNIVATDKSGNKANKVVRVTYDTTAPDIKVEGGLENGKEYDKAEQSFTVRASSDVTKVQVFQNGKLIKEAEYKAGDKVAVDAVLNNDNEANPGLNTFNVVAFDKAGNKNNEVVRVTYASVAKVESVSAINAKTLEVKFNKAVDDTKAKFEVKKDGINVNAAKVTLSEDKKVAHIELSSNLFAGEYTVNVTGLSEDTLTGSVKVENEKVAKIELLGEVAPINEGNLKVAYRVTNQYGEDITKSPLASAIDWTALPSKSATDDDNGTLTIVPADGSTFKVGDKIAITGINQSSTVVVTGSVTVSSEAITDSVEFKGLYNKDNKELQADSDFAQFTLLLDGKDQYGKSVDATQLTKDVAVYSSNESIVKVGTFKDKQGANKDQVGLELVKPDSNVSGKAIVTVISKSTGKVAQFEVNVKATPAVSTFTMNQPTSVIAKGDKVEIPFTAADQYGNAITKFDDLNGKVQFSTDELKIEKGDKGVAVLYYTPSEKGTKVLVATVPASGKVAQLMVDVKDTATPVSIESLNDVTTSVAVNGEVEIGLKNIVIKDQFGRTVKGEDFITKGYSIKAEKADKDAEALTITNEAISSKDDVITIEGSKKGSADIKFAIYDKDGNKVNTSVLTKSFSVVDKSAYKSFEIANIATLYADGDNETHTRDLKVYGVREDGTKILLPKKDYTVITSDSVEYKDGKLNATVAANAANTFDSKGELAAKVTVIVDGFETPTTIVKDVVISNAAPKADTIEYTDSVEDGSADISASKLNSVTTDATDLSTVLKVTDQYGVVIEDFTPNITITNIKEKTVDTDVADRFTVSNNGKTNVDIENAEAGDVFTATYLLDGKTSSVKFTVVAPE